MYLVSILILSASKNQSRIIILKTLIGATSPKLFTVNLEIFVRVLFLRNFAYGKFRENKSSRISKITLLITDIGKSCTCREFLTAKICVLTLFAKIKFSRKFPNLQYHTVQPAA